MLPNWRVHPGQGPYLLLVHGFLCSRALWQLNLEALGAVCQPVTLELYGHNCSGSPADPAAYQPTGYLNAFEEIRQTLGANRWFVFGYSLGAGLTLRYALTQPEHVIGHGFSNSTSAFADDTQRAKWRAGAATSAAHILDQGAAAIERIAVHPKNAKQLPRRLYNALLEDAQNHTPLGIANTLRYTNPDTSVRSLISGNQRPALLTWGAKEKRFTTHAEFAIQHMPNLTVKMLPTGHGVNMEAHGVFNNALIRFIQQCPTS